MWPWTKERAIRKTREDYDREKLLDNPPSKAEFLDWKSSLVTKYLIAQKESEYESLKEEWARGGFTKDSADASNQQNLRKQGEADALYWIIEDLRTIGANIDEDEQGNED